MRNTRYGQYCPLAYALDVVGDRWTLLIVRELLYGPRNYQSMLSNLPDIGALFLTKRLTRLEREGLIQRLVMEPRSASEPYALTDRGLSLVPIIKALAKWGLPLLELPGEEDVYAPTWSLLELEARFRPERAINLSMVFELWVDEEVFQIQIERNQLRARIGAATSPVFTMKTDAASFILLLRGVQHIKEGLQSKRMVVEGSLAALSRALDALDLHDAESKLQDAESSEATPSIELFTEPDE